MNDIKMNRQFGTKWFTFYTKVRPWLACLMVFSSINDFLQYTEVYVSNWWLLLYFAVGITSPILGIMVFVKSRGDYVDFVRFVKGVLLFETIAIPYTAGVQQYLNNGLQIIASLISTFFVLLLTYFVWYRLNVKYFEKRINVATYSFSKESNYVEETLVNNEDIREKGFIIDKDVFEEVLEIKNTDILEETNVQNECFTEKSSKILFCRKCGSKLLEDSVFCSKCGTKVITLDLEV